MTNSYVFTSLKCLGVVSSACAQGFMYGVVASRRVLCTIHIVELNLPAVGGFVWPIRREVSSCGMFN
jgi:hypothetical protein